MQTVIAIDGPAASGKSSVARVLARRLGWLYVNSGAMYRAVAWLAASRQVPPTDGAQVMAALEKYRFECGIAGAESTISIDGADPSANLTDPAVNSTVSAIASIPEVR